MMDEYFLPNLPSSQDLLDLLQNYSIQGVPSALTVDDLNNAIANWEEQSLCPNQELPSNPEAACFPSSLPGTESWPGSYNFRVFLNPPKEDLRKSAHWIYSSASNKLYIKKDAPCPINYCTNTLMHGGVKIRAAVYFSSPADVNDVVPRCFNHYHQDTTNGIENPEHLVKSESSQASYEVDEKTQVHSVVIPFLNPPDGQNFSFAIYKFCCLSSCAGGPNRRPLMLVFTLEIGNKVIGRQRIELKVCSCPHRDMLNDEKDPKPSVKRKLPDAVPKPAPKKPMKKDTEAYFIKVQDKSCYRFLKQMKKLYFMCIAMRGFVPDVTTFCKNFLSSSEELSSSEKNSD